MITVDGYEYGTAAEIAARLGADITAQRVRDWARRSRNPHDRLHGRLPAHRVQGLGVRYRLDQAAAVELLTSASARGRPRSLDSTRLST